MTFHWLHVTQKGEHTLSSAHTQALARGIEVRESTRRCEVFTDNFKPVEYRHIGYVRWNRTRNTRQVWVNADATRDDVTAAAVGAVQLLSPRGVAQPVWHWKMVKGDEVGSAQLCRRLDEYGNDLCLVVGIPDTVPVDLSEGHEQHTRGLGEQARG